MLLKVSSRSSVSPRHALATAWSDADAPYVDWTVPVLVHPYWPCEHVDVLGNAAFTIVQGDLKGNIAVSPHAEYHSQPQ